MINNPRRRFLFHVLSIFFAEAVYIYAGKLYAEPSTLYDYSKKIMIKFDKNQDGRISKNEYKGDVGDFYKIDINNDGYISLREIANRIESKRQNNNKNNQETTESSLRDNSSRRQTEIGENSKDVIPSNISRTVDHIINKNDKDGDGKISRSEFGKNTENFNKLDLDADNYLSRFEVAQFIQDASRKMENDKYNKNGYNSRLKNTTPSNEKYGTKDPSILLYGLLGVAGLALATQDTSSENNTPSLNNHGYISISYDPANFPSIAKDITANFKPETSLSYTFKEQGSYGKVISDILDYGVYDIEINVVVDDISKSFKISNVNHHCKTTRVRIVRDDVETTCE